MYRVTLLSGIVSANDAIYEVEICAGYCLSLAADDYGRFFYCTADIYCFSYAGSLPSLSR